MLLLLKLVAAVRRYKIIKWVKINFQNYGTYLYLVVPYQRDQSGISTK